MKVKILETNYITDMPPYAAFLLVLEHVAEFVAETSKEQNVIDQIMKLVPRPENYWYENVPEDLEQIVMDEFRDNPTRQITSDLVHAKIMSKAQGRSPRIVGSVFMSLKRKGLIRPVGSTATERDVAHKRRIVCWQKC